MPRKTRNRPPSLLDSKGYQSALKINKIESNKLEKIGKVMEANNNRTSFLHKQEWESTQQWLLDISKTSGKADLEKYNQLLKDKEEEEGEATHPQYYFMYGIRIGERPQLLKNFLGRKVNKNIKVDQKGQPKKNFAQMARPTNNNESHFDESSSVTNEEHRQIIVDGQVMTQYPIGYTRAGSGRASLFRSCSSEQIKEERNKKPLYYTQKHKYIIPPVSMFR